MVQTHNESFIVNRYSKEKMVSSPDKKEVNLINLANFLTFLRLMLVPAFAVFLSISGGNNNSYLYIAILTFLIAILTDNLDGYVARKYDLVTELGKLIDPIADKLLIGTALILLAYFQFVPWWIVILIIFREAFITFLRFKKIASKGVLAADFFGKLKTFLQAFCVFLSLMIPVWGGKQVVTILWVITLAVTIYSGWQIIKNIK